MKKISDNVFLIIVTALFIILNLLNTYIVTSSLFNQGMNLYRITFQSLLNSFLGDLGFLLLLTSIVYLSARKKKTIVISLSLITVFLSVMVFLLKMYALYYETAFSFFNIRTFSNHAPILGRQLTIKLWQDLFITGQFLAIIPALVFLVIIILMFNKKRFKENSKIAFNHTTLLRVVKGIIVGLSFSSLSLINYQYVLKASQFSSVDEPLKGVQSVGLYNYYTNNIISYITSGNYNNHPMDSSLLEKGELFLEEKTHSNPLNFFDQETNNSEAIFKNKNLVILQMESFNNFLVNLTITDPDTEQQYEVTPFVNSLANDNSNLYYKYFYSNIGTGKTSDAEFATFTGIYPDGENVTYYNYIHDDYETLPKLFNEKNYSSYTISGSVANFYRRDAVYKSLGFLPENYLNQNTMEKDGYYNPEIESHTVNGWVDDNVVFEQVLDLLRRDEKQFIFALSTVLHVPYSEHETITKDTVWEDLVPGQMGRYLAYANYFDRAFETFYTNLIAEDLLNDTVFILYGDHKLDVSVFELSKILPEAVNIMDFQHHQHNIPLIISANNIDLSAYRESTELVRGQADLKRTIVNLFDLNAIYNFGIDILTLDKTITYVPLTLDVFADDFHLSVRRNEIVVYDNEDYEIDILVEKFYKLKEQNDILFKYNFFKNDDDET
ncbi:MAG: sulfatase-like hydrolase/transferase [Acholeplasmataceae bacterium]|jgi:phosphoglycerol transferase MdoB-like AlkP superfamily enzyme|nr:sulfatase-like hydrolase/transferase [Acholeplasmataceae bacterium]